MTGQNWRAALGKRSGNQLRWDLWSGKGGSFENLSKRLISMLEADSRYKSKKSFPCARDLTQQYRISPPITEKESVVSCGPASQTKNLNQNHCQGS